MHYLHIIGLGQESTVKTTVRTIVLFAYPAGWHTGPIVRGLRGRLTQGVHVTLKRKYEGSYRVHQSANSPRVSHTAAMHDATLIGRL